MPNNPNDPIEILGLENCYTEAVGNKIYVRPKWIKCSDRLPDKQDLYLCCGSLIDWNMSKTPDTIFTAYFYLKCDVHPKDYWVERTRGYEDVTITHWMPLPEAPND